MPNLPEDFVQAVWQHRLFACQGLALTDGRALEVLSPGLLNRDAGPDFAAARLRIGTQTVHGPVEIHTHASHWHQHGHSQNPAYDAVALHVVLHPDAEVLRADGTPLPMLDIGSRLLPGVLLAYERILPSALPLPCAPALPHIRPLIASHLLDRLGTQRLETKAARVAQSEAARQGNWAQAFYEALARALGQSTNGEALEGIARQTPVALLRKYANNPVQVEALLFGQAHLLPPPAPTNDAYVQRLHTEYAFLQKKHSLSPATGTPLKFGRMRPAMLPTVRVALLAALVLANEHLVAQALEAPTLAQAARLFQVKAGAYWHTHYTFNKEAKPWAPALNEEGAMALVLNAVAPTLYAYGQSRGKSALMCRALEWWEALPPESNTHTRFFADAGWQAANALQTQGMLALHTEGCAPRKCLQCAVGIAALSIAHSPAAA